MCLYFEANPSTFIWGGVADSSLDFVFELLAHRILGVKNAGEMVCSAII